MSFASQMISFYNDLELDLSLSKDVIVLDPFIDTTVQKACSWYHNTFFKGNQKRYFLFGINPGRFGAGVTGIPFTDPIQIEEMGFPNPWQKRHELSAIYIQELIEAYGGLKLFADSFYISSACPLGFVKDGKNINYYDEVGLQKDTKEFITNSLKQQIKIGCKTDVAFSLGKGKNFKFLSKLNKEEKLFDEIIPLPHPRWVMQYKLKLKDHYIDYCVEQLRSRL